MNPVLLKPGSDRTSQVVLLGRPVGELSARGYHDGRQRELLATVAGLPGASCGARTTW